MQKIFMVVFLLCLSASTAQASKLTCSMDDDRGDRDYTAGVVDVVHMNCGLHSVQVKGLGLGLRRGAKAQYYVFCSNSNPSGTYYGLKADAAFPFGLGLAVYANNDGSCFLIGDDVTSFGIDVTASRLRIK